MKEQEIKEPKQKLESSKYLFFIFQQVFYMLIAGFIGWRLGIYAVFLLAMVWSVSMLIVMFFIPVIIKYTKK